MPIKIIDQQRRLHEVGRIRTGEQVPTQNGKARPAKLSKFRLTSRDRQVIDAAAALWGGEVRPWTAPDGDQWEVYTETAALPVIVPPVDMAFSQFYEQWSAGGCQVRCDGEWDLLNDKVCHCDPEDRACKIKTRLSVILPDLPGLGVWRLETGSFYGAVELNGAVDVCRRAGAQGTMLPARLRLEQRRVVRDDPKTGKPQTLRFAVAVLDLDIRVGQLLAGVAPGELGTGSMASMAPADASPVPAFAPVPDGFGPPPLAEQLAAIDHPPARTTQRAPLPATGLAPRTVADIPPVTPTAPVTSIGGRKVCIGCGSPLYGPAEMTPAGPRHKVCPDEHQVHDVLDDLIDGVPVPKIPAPVEELPLDDPRDDHDRQRRRFHAIAGKRWPVPFAERDIERKKWLKQWFNTPSLKTLTARQVAEAADWLEKEVADHAAGEGEGT